MLQRNFRFLIVNKTGATIQFSTDSANNTFTITGRGWKLDSEGGVTYGSEQTLMSSPGADLNNNASAEGTAVDNSSNLYFGYHCTATLTTDAATAGTIDIYLEWSTDGGTTFPSDAPDFDPEVDLIGPIRQVATDSSNDDRTTNFTIGAE